MKAEHAARDLTYHAGQQSTSDSLFQVPPDPVFGCTTLQGEWPGAAAVNLDAFRPDGLDRLYLLGGCADIAREAAARMLRRCELIAVGDRIGRAAAGDAKSATALQVASVAAGQLAGGPAKDVREFLAPLRPTEAPRTVKQPARPIPVFGEFGAIVEGSQVKGVIVTTPDGRGAVLARTVIDATGSATVAAMAGASALSPTRPTSLSREPACPLGTWDATTPTPTTRSRTRTTCSTSVPMLKRAFAAADSGEDKRTYARILATMGDATGVDVLIDELKAAESWDKGWNYRAMGQFGANMSPLDAMVYALGKAGDRRAVPAIVAKANLLTAELDFSHHRAVALALELLRAPEAAAVLADVLSRPGMRGHAIPSIDSAVDSVKVNMSWTALDSRRNSLRELSLARALYRCGDKDGLGRTILEEYSRDMRGHWATHARAVLAE